MTSPPVISALPWPSLLETNWARPMVPPAPGMLTTWMPLARPPSCSALCMARPVWSQPPPGAAGHDDLEALDLRRRRRRRDDRSREQRAAPAASNELYAWEPPSWLCRLRLFACAPRRHVDGSPLSGIIAICCRSARSRAARRMPRSRGVGGLLRARQACDLKRRRVAGHGRIAGPQGSGSSDVQDHPSHGRSRACRFLGQGAAGRAGCGQGIERAAARA